MLMENGVKHGEWRYKHYGFTIHVHAKADPVFGSGGAPLSLTLMWQLLGADQ